MDGSAISTGIMDTNRLIWGTKRYFVGAIINTDGTNAAVINIYDNTTNSGTIVARLVCSGSDRTKSINFGPNGVRAENGLYFELVGGPGATGIVFHK